MNPTELTTTTGAEDMGTVLIEAISGPASATVIMVVILFCLFKYVGPIIEKTIGAQKAALENIMTEHKEDRKAYQESISALTLEIKGLSSNTQLINSKLEKLHERIEDVERKLR